MKIKKLKPEFCIFVRKGNECNEVPFNSNTDVNFNVTENDHQEVYENHPQFKNLNDEQRERIKGTANTAGLDEGGNRGGRSSLGTSSEGSERSNEKGRTPGLNTEDKAKVISKSPTI